MILLLISLAFFIGGCAFLRKATIDAIDYGGRYVQPASEFSQLCGEPIKIVLSETTGRKPGMRDIPSYLIGVILISIGCLISLFDIQTTFPAFFSFGVSALLLIVAIRREISLGENNFTMWNCIAYISFVLSLIIGIPWSIAQTVGCF